MDIYRWCGKNRFSLRQCLLEDYKCLLIGKEKGNLPNMLKDRYDDVPHYINKYKILDECGGNEPWFVFMIPSYNNIKYVIRNLESVYRQNYINYRVVYIDDSSNDSTYDMVCNVVSQWDMWERTIVFRSPRRNYQSGSRFIGYHLCDDDEILCMLDGDDWLANDNVLSILSKYYKEGSLCSYGSYRMYYGMGKVSPDIYGNEIFPNDIIRNREFRGYRWTSCHLRTGYAGLFRRVHMMDLMDDRGYFSRCCTDLCEMFPVLEMASPYISRVRSVLYIYNREASNGYSNSFYNQNKNPLEKVYRQNILNKISRTNRYSSVSIEDIFQNRNNGVDREGYSIYEEVEREFMDMCLYILDVTKIDFLGYDLELKNPISLYKKDIQIGRLYTSSIDLLIKRRGVEFKEGDWVVSISLS